jgi:NAD(P)-dependent dehydrogenase (short-subunit alcohol dehydrogenase family)
VTEEPRVALVTGASRGVGKGIAAVLASAGWLVYFTGRSDAEATEDVGGTLRETAAAIEQAGGSAVAVRCDHGDDAQVEGLFTRIGREAGRLDLLVNNFYAGPDHIYDGRPFFERPVDEWDPLMARCLRGHYVASVRAGQLMSERRRGLIVNVSSFGGAAYLGHVLYGMQKAALDKMAHDMAVELRPYDVHALSLWLGPVLTEKVRALDVRDIMGFSLAEAETPGFVGQVICALADDPDLPHLTGATLVAAEVAERLGITNEDGGRPPSLRGRLGAPRFGAIPA